MYSGVGVGRINEDYYNYIDTALSRKNEKKNFNLSKWCLKYSQRGLKVEFFRLRR